MALEHIILAVIIGTLAAIVYCLKVMFLLESRIARIDKHIELMAKAIIKEEGKIEKMLKKKKK